LIEGLLDGTIDFIATDHAPHAEAEKAEGMQLAPFGIVGLETAFPLLYTHLVQTKKFTLKQIVDFLTIKPTKAFGLQGGKLQVGETADITVVDLETETKIDPETFLSKGKNTPFTDWACKGWPTLTIVNGQIVWRMGGITV
jgi:dihydroorotase